MACQNGSWGGYSITLFVVVLCCFPYTVDCLSLEIKDNQTEFTFEPESPLDIYFYLNNASQGEDTHMYVYKEGTEPSCKLVMTRFTCEKQHGNCNCSFDIRQKIYKLTRTFQTQDSGDWVLDVWNTNIQKTVHLRASGRTQTTTSIFSISTATTSTLPSTSTTLTTTPVVGFTCFLTLMSLWCQTSY